MDLEQIKAFLDANKDNEEVAAFVNGLNPVTIDRVKDFVTNDEEGKTFLQAEKDRYFSKGLDTWKKNNLDSLVAAKVSELYPEETEEAKRIKVLEQQIKDVEREKTRESLLRTAVSVASDKKLPTKFIDRFLGEDEEETLKNLSTFEEVWNASITEAVEGEFKRNGFDPGNGSKPGGQGPVKSLSEQIQSVQIRQS